MSKNFTIRDKLFSLRGRIEVTDANDQLAYEALRKFALFRSSWTLHQNQQWTANISRKLFSWTPTWLVQTGFGEFTITRKLFSMTRTYRLYGDHNEALELRGNLWGKDFTITRGNHRLAAANGKWFSLRDTQAIELFSDDPEDEVLVVIAMIALHLDRKEDGDERGG